jgi:hypothetical protein
LDQQALSVLKGFREQQEFKDLKVHKVPLDLLVLKAYKDLRVIQVQLVHKVLQDHKEFKA